MSALCAAFCASLVLAAAGSAFRTANPTLYVSFFANGSASVAAADGTTVDTSSASPTVIPAGYYTLLFQDGGECIPLPYFRLSGPGVDVTTDAASVANNRVPTFVHLLPASTYSWTDGATPGVVHQFSTTTQVLGSPPAAAGRSPGTFTSKDVVGSALHPLVGSLNATIAANGTITVRQDGRQAKKLKPGKYRFTIISHDPQSGFVIRRLSSHIVAVTGGPFSGKRSVTVNLTAGKWIFVATHGRASSPFLVH